jgi:hypothetical protein
MDQFEDRIPLAADQHLTIGGIYLDDASDPDHIVVWPDVWK